MKKLKKLDEALTGSLLENFHLQEISAEPYAAMRWPRFPALMRFEVKRYRAAELGHLMIMRTRAMGMMELLTASFMPAPEQSLPFLLLDMMAAGKKRTVFVEYYDCTADGVCLPAMKEMQERFRDLPDYSEKPAWYCAERMEGSLIKGAQQEQEERLAQMITESLRAYAEAAKSAGQAPGNRAGLERFVQRMIEEGNPSSSVMEKVLGKEGAERFFRTVVMPLE